MSTHRKHILFRLGRSMRSGFKSLLLHRLRSILTMLGMVFGVCSVIAMLAIGEGANHEAQQQIKELGSQNIILKSVKPTDEEAQVQKRENTMTTYGLTYEDVQIIQETIPGVTVIVPDRKRRDFVYRDREVSEVEVVGTVPWYLELRGRQMKTGRFLNDRDVQEQGKVCILEERLARTLFPIHHVMGSTVRVGRHYFEVVGILQDKKEKGAGGGSSAEESLKATPPNMFIALTTARAMFGEITVEHHGESFQAEEVELHEVTVRVDRLEDVENVAAIVYSGMARRHPKQDFDMVVPLELLRQANRTKAIFNIVLGSIAAISLLVGGIGIMNIMLASVSERTREIGIRRALGAKRIDIISQFLVETAILAGTGGMLGVALGILIPALVGVLTSMITIVTWWSPVVAFTISSLTGVIFGIYPAYQAARMHPVEALRHE
jgi:putative ABC transport system permease protein